MRVTASLLLSVGIVIFTTPYMGMAAAAFFLLCLGLYHRKTPKVHVPLVNIGIAIDLLLVLVLEFERSAIETAISFTLTSLQQAHIGASTIALVLYFPVLGLGWLQYSGKKVGPRIRLVHIRLGLTAFAFRTLGFILMFSMLPKYRL